MIKLLDCTLRDGGYVNNWNFGKEAIDEIMNAMLQTNVDIVEAGFIRDVEYKEGAAVFSDVRQVDALLEKRGIKKKNAMIAVMAEISRPIPLEKIAPAEVTGVDIIRVIVWRTKHLSDGTEVDALNESLEYCRGIVKKGYKLCVQPNRTDQYSDDEFVKMINMFSSINPYAIYVVDSWGTMYSNQILHYMKLADSILPKNVRIGFHGHNNMMQAFSTAEKIIETEWERDILLDASVDGIGRGAGNLNLELIARYMNHERGCDYKLKPICEIYDHFIKNLREKYTWGSSFQYMLSADKNANPNYASDFTECLSISEMLKAYDSMTADDRILYTSQKSKKFMEKVKD